MTSPYAGLMSAYKEIKQLKAHVMLGQQNERAMLAMSIRHVPHLAPTPKYPAPHRHSKDWYMHQEGLLNTFWVVFPDVKFSTLASVGAAFPFSNGLCQAGLEA